MVLYNFSSLSKQADAGCCVWRLCSKLTVAACSSPHRTIDEGKRSFNRHDSLFDWELCPKASTLQASKQAGCRLCSSSSSPVSLIFGLFFVTLLLQCPSPHGISRPVPPFHPLLFNVPLIVESHANVEHDLWSFSDVVNVYASLWNPSSPGFVCRDLIQFSLKSI